MPIQWITLQIEVGVDFKLHPFMLTAMKIHRTLSQALQAAYCIVLQRCFSLNLDTSKYLKKKKYWNIENTSQIVTIGPACLE